MKRGACKLISIILAAVLLFGSQAVLCAVALETESERHYPSIVIPGIFQSDVRLYDADGNEIYRSDGSEYEKPFYLEPTGDIVKEALRDALIPIGKMLLLQNDRDAQAAKAIADVLGNVLAGRVRSDSTGHFIENVQAVSYNTSLANLSEFDREYALDQIPLREYAAKAGLDHLYFFSYASLGNIREIAGDLFDLIQIAKEETGSDKVNLAPISQGGSIFNALMQIYLDKGLRMEDDIHRVVFIVPAADGAAVLGDIYHYGLLDDDDALYGYMFPSLLDEDQQWLAYLINIILRYLPNADVNRILDMAVDTLINDYLGNSTCLWALIPSKDYPDCREKYLSDPEDAVIREQTDWYYDIQMRCREEILRLQTAGVQFFDVVDYNVSLYHICDSWDKVNADGIIHTDSESFGATSYGVDVPLPEGYQQANTYCTDPSHCHIDPAGVLDASTGILCETTFYFYGQNHESTARNDVIIRLATNLLLDDRIQTVHSDPAFPQFNYGRDSRKLNGLYNNWKNYDASALSESDRAELASALEEARAAVESTTITQEEYGAAYNRLYQIAYRIENGTAPEQKSDRLKDFLVKFFKFISDFMLKYFGGKGYSDIILFR